MSARHRQAERRRREAKLLTEALLREAGSVAAAVIDAKLPARSGAVALRATAEPEAVERDQVAGNARAVQSLLVLGRVKL